MNQFLFKYFFLFSIFGSIYCPPIQNQETTTLSPQQEALGLEYERYLKEVVSVLESDEEFKKKLESTNATNIKSGEIARHLNLVGHHIRTKLDELKRTEVDRLKTIIKLQESKQGKEEGHVDVSEFESERLVGHLEFGNPHSFEVKDLQKLILKATNDMEEIDLKRRGEFKTYEMEKEHKRRVEMNQLDDQKRREAELKLAEEVKKRQEVKINHPGNEEQLKEVWEETDDMEGQQFDAKTFFKFHDKNDDGVLDANEVEALFEHELDKIYDPKNPETDLNERYEDMNRMREHLVKEVDLDKNGLISLDELIQSTNKEEFKKDENWEPVDSKKEYTEEELAAFEKAYEEELRRAQERDQQLSPTPVTFKPKSHDDSHINQGQTVQPEAQGYQQLPGSQHHIKQDDIGKDGLRGPLDHVEGPGSVQQASVNQAQGVPQHKETRAEHQFHVVQGQQHEQGQEGKGIL